MNITDSNNINATIFYLNMKINNLKYIKKLIVCARFFFLQ